MSIDLKPLAARILAAIIAWATAKAAAHGVTFDISPDTQAAMIVALYGALHSLSKQIFGKKGT